MAAEEAIGGCDALADYQVFASSHRCGCIIATSLGAAANPCAIAFTPYFPELFPTRLRATGVGFCFNIARIFAAIGPFIAGSLVVFFGGIPKSGAIMALSYAIGLAAVYFAPETRGKPLPE